MSQQIDRSNSWVLTPLFSLQDRTLQVIDDLTHSAGTESLLKALRVGMKDTRCFKTLIRIVICWPDIRSFGERNNSRKELLQLQQCLWNEGRSSSQEGAGVVTK